MSEIKSENKGVYVVDWNEIYANSTSSESGHIRLIQQNDKIRKVFRYYVFEQRIDEISKVTGISSKSLKNFFEGNDYNPETLGKLEEELAEKGLLAFM